MYFCLSVFACLSVCLRECMCVSLSLQQHRDAATNFHSRIKRKHERKSQTNRLPQLWPPLVFSRGHYVILFEAFPTGPAYQPTRRTNGSFISPILKSSWDLPEKSKTTSFRYKNGVRFFLHCCLLVVMVRIMSSTRLYSEVFFSFLVVYNL